MQQDERAVTESVWDYPRPPRVEAARWSVRVEVGGHTIAESDRALRVLETSHPPVYYIPVEDIVPGALRPAAGRSFCEFKGFAGYWDVVLGPDLRRAAAWSYEDPSSGYEQLRGHVAFYPSRVDACFVDDERVEAQAGDFYGGWITASLTGPFKGGPGTAGW